MIKIITTFSKEGYNLYGKKWLESAVKFLSSDISVTVYVDFELDDTFSLDLTIKDFLKEFPNHLSFSNNIRKNFSDDIKQIKIGEKVIKFSHKAFVINNELKCNNDILVWLDGDVEIINNLTKNDFENLLSSNFLACQTEKQNYKFPHIESGILIFNCRHPITEVFQQKLEEYYYSDKIFLLKKPYDGYVIGRILREYNLPFFDFNKNIEVLDKKSKKDLTFQHPFLKQNFIHRIGSSKKELNS